MIELHKFALAGNATFTVVSKRTNQRFTFRVRKPKDNQSMIHFVSVLTGPDNERSYTNFAHIRNCRWMKFNRKSRISQDAPSSKAWAWIWLNIQNQKKMEDLMEIFHEGKCCRCGRKLTVPESITWGVGPECLNYVLEKF